ncbi:MAG TPA: hypothetical protein VFL83_12085, partial [Anaeromyxobacter sp.]|nr:hypothetical protein [Anaeromyxobacter sp.]
GRSGGEAVTRALALALLAAGCATAKAPAGASIRQAEHGLPAATEFADGPDRAAYAAAHAHEAKGDAAGAADASRAEWAQAAAGYAAIAERPAAADWRIPLRHRATELFLRAQRWEEAARTAEALVADAGASDASRAVAARLAATAALGAAGAAVRAGQLEKLDLAPRRDAAPRTPPPAWKRVVDATDAYLARSAADPEAARRPSERRPGVSPPDLALTAAEVQLAQGDLDDARRRLQLAIDRWPADGEVLEQAAPLVLATYAARGDRAGHDAELERLRARAAQEGAGAGDARDKEAFGRAQEALGRTRAGSRFGDAERLAAEGKPGEAARAFEALAAEPGMPEPANALHNAAVAWEKAGEPAKAAAVRARIVEEHPGSRVAPEDALALADALARRGDPLAAARAYDDYLARWPEGPGRCVALQNVASELERAGRPAEAAARYAAFGSDAGCAKGAPDLAARALVAAGRLFDAQARTAYGAAAAVQGVADPEAKKLVTEAKRRLRGP